MKRITRIIRPIICMAVLLFAMTTAVMGCYQKETGSIDIPGRTPSGTYIERATYELRRERRVRVATSDGPEQVMLGLNVVSLVPLAMPFSTAHSTAS